MFTAPLALVAKAAIVAALAVSGHVTVAAGDTLSGIAYSHGDSLAAIESVNRQIANPNLIYPGQVVNLPGSGATTTASAADHESDGDSDDPQPTHDPGGRYFAPAGTFQQCVISRESGGNPSAVNPVSGAGGLYQFLPSTWHALGYSGLPEYAPVWEQNQAFARLYAQAGTSPWAPYDHCT